MGVTDRLFSGITALVERYSRPVEKRIDKPDTYLLAIKWAKGLEKLLAGWQIVRGMVRQRFRERKHLRNSHDVPAFGGMLLGLRISVLLQSLNDLFVPVWARAPSRRPGGGRCYVPPQKLRWPRVVIIAS